MSEKTMSYCLKAKQKQKQKPYKFILPNKRDQSEKAIFWNTTF